MVTRAASIARAIANKLNVEVSELPVVTTAPEAAMEKAVSIGTGAVAMGLPTHVGVAPPVIGSPFVVKVLTETAKELLGGYFIVEPDPKAAAAQLVAALKERRAGLGDLIHEEHEATRIGPSPLRGEEGKEYREKQDNTK